MKLMGRFLRVLDEVMRAPGPRFVQPPWLMITPQEHMPPKKITDTASASDTNKKNIDPNDKDSEDKKRNTVSTSFLKDLPYSTKRWPYIDLPEGRVHISRYYP